jgi:hypothetical protein
MKQTIVFSQTDVVCNLKKIIIEKWKSAKKCKATVSSKLIFKSFERVQKLFLFELSNSMNLLIRKDWLVESSLNSTFFSSLIMNFSELEIVSKLTLGFSMIFACIASSALSISLDFNWIKNKLPLTAKRSIGLQS